MAEEGLDRTHRSNSSAAVPILMNSLQSEFGV